MVWIARDAAYCKLADFTPQEIADATGLSVGHCKRIRRGTRMPGVRWWGALEMMTRPLDPSNDCG